jgi:hypothetical protein
LPLATPTFNNFITSTLPVPTQSADPNKAVLDRRELGSVTAVSTLTNTVLSFTITRSFFADPRTDDITTATSVDTVTSVASSASSPATASTAPIAAVTGDTTPAAATPTGTPNQTQDKSNNATGWAALSGGAKAGIIIAIIIGIALIAAAIFYCCGGRALLQKRKKNYNDLEQKAAHAVAKEGTIGMTGNREMMAMAGNSTMIGNSTMTAGSTAAGNSAEAPPQYEEAVRDGASESSVDVIADGKPPLSEEPPSKVKIPIIEVGESSRAGAARAGSSSSSISKANAERNHWLGIESIGQMSPSDLSD